MRRVRRLLAFRSVSGHETAVQRGDRGNAFSLARSRIILTASKLEASMDTQKHANGTQPGSGAVEQTSNMNGKGRKPSARTRSARLVGAGRSAGHADNPE